MHRSAKSEAGPYRKAVCLPLGEDPPDRFAKSFPERCMRAGQSVQERRGPALEGARGVPTPTSVRIRSPRLKPQA